MKLLIASPYYYPKIGGLESYVFHLVEQLTKKKDIDIIVITSNYESNLLQIDYDKKTKVKIYRLPIQFKLSNTPISFKWSADIKKIIQDEKPDIINVHSPVPFIADVTASVSNNIPLILTYHAGSMLKNIFYIDWIIKIYENYFLQKLFKRSNKIISYSPEFIKTYLKPYKNKVVYIPPGVNKDLFKPSNSPKQNKIIFVGRIEKTSEWKGIHVLLDAVKILKVDKIDIKLELVGPGDAIGQYKAYAKELGIVKNITFLGALRDQELVKKIQSSKVLVLPSTSNAESFGIVLIEAMSCEVPVIGSNIGGIPYVIDDGINGLLFESGNTKKLVEAIKKIISNKDLQKKLGTNGRKKVEEHYTWEITTEKFQQIINEFI